jgi:hypothetical protein
MASKSAGDTAFGQSHKDIGMFVIVRFDMPAVAHDFVTVGLCRAMRRRRQAVFRPATISSRLLDVFATRLCGASAHKDRRFDSLQHHEQRLEPTHGADVNERDLGLRITYQRRNSGVWGGRVRRCGGLERRGDR